MGVIDFYDRHPLDEEHVLASAARRRGTLAGLRAEDLFEFDQDHYGGLAAVETLARRAGAGPGSQMLDVCAGLGGPARFLAQRLGCRVVALELNHGRAASAARLTQRVGLSRLVSVVRGDAIALPFAPARFDACVSQEGLLHIEDKAAVLRECRRVLVPGGRLAFTDWIARPRLADRERARLREWMAATNLQSVDDYRGLLGRAGFTAIDAEDVSDDWRPVLHRRLQMQEASKMEAAARFGERWAQDFLELTRFFVALVEAGKLGGGRFTARS